MKIRHTTGAALALLAALLSAGLAQAALPKPAPTPAQQQAAAAKKAQADAQAAKDKASLAASIDAVTAHWRSTAAQQGWKSHPPVAIAAATPAAGGASQAAQPAGQTPAAAAAAAQLIKSEKLGTAPPSEDVKKHPTVAEPKNAKPTVNKGAAPEDVSKK